MLLIAALRSESERLSCTFVAAHWPRNRLS